MHLSDCFLEIFTFVRILTDSDEMADAEYEIVRGDFTHLVERMEDRARKGGFPPVLYDQARFAVFAWVDETVLCSNWNGTGEWLKNTLQREYYGTANAGEEFFDRLNSLLKGSVGKVDESLFEDFDEGGGEKSTRSEESDVTAEAIEVFTLCLSLGYSGAYFNESDSERLDRLREECLTRIMGRYDSEGLEVFPNSYIVGKAVGRRPGYNRFFDPVMLVFFVLPLVILGGIYLSYRYLLEEVLHLWLG